jgi:hypothetical protein
MARQMYHCVGESGGASIRDLCIVFGQHARQAAIVYYRTPTLDARIQLTDELIRTVLPERHEQQGGHDHEDVQTWNRVRKEIADILPIRNRLAHRPVSNRTVFHGVLPGATPLDPEAVISGVGAVADLFRFSWFESYVSEAEKLRGRHEDIQPLTTPDLSTHRVDVARAITLLEMFRKHVLSKYVRSFPEPSSAPR